MKTNWNNCKMFVFLSKSVPLTREMKKKNVCVHSLNEMIWKKKFMNVKQKANKLKRHYESKACSLFIWFTMGKDGSVYDLVSLKIWDTQWDLYLARQTSKNHSEIKTVLEMFVSRDSETPLGTRRLSARHDICVGLPV
jgi:hypothetical protein